MLFYSYYNKLNVAQIPHLYDNCLKDLGFISKPCIVTIRKFSGLTFSFLTISKISKMSPNLEVSQFNSCAKIICRYLCLYQQKEYTTERYTSLSAYTTIRQVICSKCIQNFYKNFCVLKWRPIKYVQYIFTHIYQKEFHKKGRQ